MPSSLRVLNAPVVYVTYIGKAIWPAKLSVFYPLPSKLPVVPAIASVLALVIVTSLIFHWQSRLRWLLVGWLWFLGTLVPVIGLVKVVPRPWPIATLTCP